VEQRRDPRWLLHLKTRGQPAASPARFRLVKKRTRPRCGIAATAPSTIACRDRLTAGMTAQEAFNAVSGGGFDDLRTVLAICERHGGYCVIGGLAVNTYVRPVFTMDADLVIAADKLPLVRADLEAAGFVAQDETWSLNVQHPSSELRIQFTKDPRYQGFLAGAIPARVLGCAAKVAALTDLVAGKVLAWSDPNRRLSKRKKDEADLIRLAESFPEIRPLLPDELRRQL
jgi:hypothetical protein